jgi:hypothetical protein
MELKNYIKILSVILISLGVLGLFSVIKNVVKPFGGNVVSNVINVLGSKTTYYPLGQSYAIASSTIPVEGMDAGTFYVGLSTGGASQGMALKLEYSPDDTNFYGLNTTASSTTVTASSTMVITSTGIEYQYIVSPTASGSTTIPVDLRGVAVKSIRVSAKALIGSTGNVWISFQGKEKL